MTRFLLDTNIISEAVKPAPSAHLLAWLGAQRDSDLFTSVIVIAEIQKGILLKEPGKRRATLEAWFDGPEGPPRLFRDRILPFDEAAAAPWARLMAADRQRSAIDMMIAATAIANNCTVATVNLRHFEGAVAVINPIEAPAKA